MCIYAIYIYTVKWSTSSLNGKKHYVDCIFLNKMGDRNTTISHRNNFFLWLFMSERRTQVRGRTLIYRKSGLLYSTLLYSCHSPKSLFFHGEQGVSSFGLNPRWILAVSSWMSEHLVSFIAQKQSFGDRLGFILLRWWLYGICGARIYQNRYRYKYVFIF